MVTILCSENFIIISYVVGKSLYIKARINAYKIIGFYYFFIRPDNFNELIIKNWNNTINNDDTVFHLGDVACGFTGRENELKQIINSLPGKKILMKGNHDTKSDDFYIDLGFESVNSYLIIEKDGLKTMLCHYPLEISIFESKKSREKQIELIDIFRKEECSYLIHGHTHNSVSKYNFAFNASVERLNYSPIQLDDCFKNLKTFQSHFSY